MLDCGGRWVANHAWSFPKGVVVSTKRFIQPFRCPREGGRRFKRLQRHASLRSLHTHQIRLPHPLLPFGCVRTSAGSTSQPTYSTAELERTFPKGNGILRLRQQRLPPSATESSSFRTLRDTHLCMVAQSFITCAAGLQSRGEKYKK